MMHDGFELIHVCILAAGVVYYSLPTPSPTSQPTLSTSTGVTTSTPTATPAGTPTESPSLTPTLPWYHEFSSIMTAFNATHQGEHTAKY
jgi:hypothetical protein